MATIIIKKRRTLTLNRTASPEKQEIPAVTQEPVISGEARTVENNRQQKEERDRNYRECKAWIFSKWPSLFDIENVKPLEIGISKRIREEYDRVGGQEVLGFGRALPVKRVLNGWTSRKAYLRALMQEGVKRYDLDGNSVSDVSQEHAEAAKEKLERRKQYAKKIKKNSKKKEA